MLFTIELFDFLFMAMINNSILTSSTRSASCDRGAPNPQGRSYGERSRNNEEVVQATQASALGRDGVHEHVTNIRMTDSHPTVEPAHVSSHILEGTADQSIHNEMYTETELTGEIFDVRGDGHYIIHAAILCLQNAGYDITHVDLCSTLVSEVITNLAYYDNFSTDDEDVIKGICRLIFDKEYNTDTCDLLVSALSNATGATITIYQYREETRNVCVGQAQSHR